MRNRIGCIRPSSDDLIFFWCNFGFMKCVYRNYRKAYISSYVYLIEKYIIVLVIHGLGSSSETHVRRSFRLRLQLRARASSFFSYLRHEISRSNVELHASWRFLRNFRFRPYWKSYKKTRICFSIIFSVSSLCLYWRKNSKNERAISTDVKSEF